MTDNTGFVSWSDVVSFTDRQKDAYKSMFNHTFTLYGGARGGGKSYWLRWAMVSWMIYQAKMGFPGIVGGLFSSTYTNLKDRQISKIGNEFPDWLGTLKENKTHGLAFYLHDKFGGGVLTLKNLDETSKYKSAEFGIIGVDELTEHTVDTFNVLIGSLRWAKLKKPCFIAGSNPDGIGNEWVKNYFINKIYPPEMQPLESEFNFVPALPTDNPHLDKSYYIMLNSLPDDLRRAWLLGDWNVFKGLAFKSFSKQKHVIEPFDIPDYWTRIIGIDSGYRAPFCALFGARNPDNGRVIVYKEIYETELTDRQQARRILDLSDNQELRAVKYADPAMWSRKTQEFITSSAEVFSQNGCFIRKGDNERLSGKRKVDRMLNNLEDGQPGLMIFNTCPNLIKQLSQLVYDPNNTEDCNSRMEDHCLIAETLVKTERGDIPINKVKTGDRVLTRKGYRNVLSSWMESPSANVFKVLFSNGANLVGTGNHPIWVEGEGWRRLDTLRYGDIINAWTNEANQSYSTELFIEDFRTALTGRTKITTHLLEGTKPTEKITFTETFGGIITVSSQWDTKSTIKTKTHLTTTSQISNVYPQKNILPDTKYQTVDLNGYARTLIESDPSQLDGINRQTGTTGTLNTEKPYLPIDLRSPRSASIVKKNTQYTIPVSTIADFVQIDADQPTGEVHELTTSNGFAPPAEMYTQLIDMRKASVAPVYVLGTYEEKNQAVYNLEVEDENEFYANGILVHNSYDALRYMLTTIRDYRSSVKPKMQKSPFQMLERI